MVLKNFEKKSIANLQELKNLASILSFLIGKKWLLIIFFFIGLICGGIFSFTRPVRFVAIQTFSLEDTKGMSASGLLGLASQFGLDVGSVGGIFSGDNIIELFKSRKIIEDALLEPFEGNNGKLLADVIQKKLTGNLSTFSFKRQQPNNQMQYIQDSLLRDLCKFVAGNCLTIERPDKKINMFVVTVTTINENFSKQFCIELVKKVSDFYIQTKNHRNQNNVDILQQKADSLKREYYATMYQKAAVNDANINPLYQLQIVPSQQRQADIAVTAAAYTEVVKNLELARYNLLRESPFIQVIDVPKLPLLQKKASILKWSLAFGFSCSMLLLILLTTAHISKFYFKRSKS